MTNRNLILTVQQALKLSNDVEEAVKLNGLGKLETILTDQDAKLTEYGYIEVIFKELVKLAKFETGDLFTKVADLLLAHYTKNFNHQDAIMGTLIYRYGLSNDGEVSLECLKKISSLIDCMGDNLGKHSKQLLLLADLDSATIMKQTIIEILEKLKAKLPQRKRPVCC